MGDIFGKIISEVAEHMNYRTYRQEVISSNIANMDTPGYKAKEMDFDASMQKAMDGVADPAVIKPSTAPCDSLDGNNVDLEGELGAMSTNKLLYQIMSQLAAAKLRQVSNVLDKEP